ncbi:D-alanine--poly(phosphoribitol) ligase subunit 2 [Hydrogenoanaerobacterium sp.]|uniref:D-alanine--poly(phosphoribitol) ligase subunit 2 n=1 Tax=Hydrogenoanaerobacterium sp. TaxID=2953763 RepID=UPI00289DC332|nr:D-alanine--poly(phosphoribitol) ligase subunit 2 [Hydrogenoanaerobacterium sp.]
MEQQILELLARVCGDDVVSAHPDINLYDAGLLDSFGFIELLDAIEDEWGITIYPTQIQRTDADTPRRVVALVQSRLQEKEG